MNSDTHRVTHLNVGCAERGDAADLRTGDTWRFEVEHGLQDRVQLRYSGRHDDDCYSTSTIQAENSQLPVSDLDCNSYDVGILFQYQGYVSDRLLRAKQ